VAKRDLSGRPAVITGAAGGLGAALARAFAEAGCAVALLDLDGDGAEEQAAALRGSGATALAIECDLTDAGACAAAIDRVRAELGDPAVLVNNAGLTHRSAFADTEIAVLRRVMEVNYFGALNVTRAALPALLRTRGALAVISSVAGFAPLLGRTGYAASKHALHGAFGTMRTELRPRGVDVTIVCPSFIDTPFRNRTLDGDGSITDHPQSRVGPMSSPAWVAAQVVAAVRRRKRLVVLGRTGKASRALTRVVPGIYERLMARALRSELER
jgi:NAD(P)-dependent dehydrogenase (short-subunit alcohol dehydrogenase family)